MGRRKEYWFHLQIMGSLDVFLSSHFGRLYGCFRYHSRDDLSHRGEVYTSRFNEQMLTDMHNSVIRHPFISIMVGAVTACESFALYIIITATSAIPIPILLLLSSVAVDLFVLIVGPFRIMANPLVKSIALLESLKRMNESKWVKRFVRSLPPSKMTLGDGKFFDKATSLVIYTMFNIYVRNTSPNGSSTPRVDLPSKAVFLRKNSMLPNSAESSPNGSNSWIPSSTSG
ncbi:hypothetical protein Fcan01_11135 [Folsomia candida]|uniref:Uncharacterized protein n=1 Tax=Folsomia candida TaxID=158441 RepID=A0A226EAN4_FOLCA|nr:hypothetical protein Fcan01_11135 [Folsomia candida]